MSSSYGFKGSQYSKVTSADFDVQIVADPDHKARFAKYKNSELKRVAQNFGATTDDLDDVDDSPDVRNAAIDLILTLQNERVADVRKASVNVQKERVADVRKAMWDVRTFVQKEKGQDTVESIGRLKREAVVQDRNVDVHPFETLRKAHDKHMGGADSVARLVQSVRAERLKLELSEVMEDAQRTVAPLAQNQGDYANEAGDTGTAKRNRPCKGQRDRLRKLVSRLIDKIDQCPETFDFGRVALPRSLLSDEPRAAKFRRHLESYAAMKCQEAGSEYKFAVPEVALLRFSL